jgi:hypothetical protein
MDISMCGGNEKVMALWAFERCSLSIPANEPLDPQEAKWISDTMRGGLIWAKNEWKGYGRQYDFTSMYPYLLQKYFFPIKKGKFDVIPDYIYNNRGNMISYYGIFHARRENHILPTYENLMAIHGERLANLNITLCRECFIAIKIEEGEFCNEHKP